MQNKGTDYIRRLLKDKTRLKRWRKMILCLSCVVVFCTVYALILPAITLERKTVCGQEEHSHTEECYSSDGQLTCGKTEHTHTESCYADDKTSEDQSGEDSQQTPEQNQTEGQEQNQGQSQEQNQDQSQDQVQTSDDGNVAQNGENGDTAGTTADETAGVTGEYVLNEHTTNITYVKLTYRENGVEKEVPIGGTVILPDDSSMMIKVGFQGIPVTDLKKSDGSFTYQLPDVFRIKKTTTSDMKNNSDKVIGTITVSTDGKVVVKYNAEDLESLGENQTIDGEFFVSAQLKLSSVNPETNQTTVHTLKSDITVKLDPDYYERYGNVTVDKQFSEKDKNSEYIKYTITVTAGDDGCKNVYVVDQFTQNKNLVNYVGIDKNETPLTTTENAQNPYETITGNSSPVAGKIYLTNALTEQAIPDPITDSTAISEPGSFVWNIAKMEAGESRTLTYYVKLKENAIFSKNMNSTFISENLINKAKAYTRKDKELETHLKGEKEVTSNVRIGYNMTKAISDQTKNADGNYEIKYEIKFGVNSDSNYPIQKFEFRDYLDYSDIYTDPKMLPYISYDPDSVELHVEKAGVAEEVYFHDRLTISWANGNDSYQEDWTDTNRKPTRFKVSKLDDSPITIYPGDSYYVTYKITVKPEVYAAMQSDKVTIKNRYLAYVDNEQGGKKINQVWQPLDLNEYSWVQKTQPKVTDQSEKISMKDQNGTSDIYCYDSSGTIKKDSIATEFTVPKGSYQYIVKVNQTQGQFNVTGATLTDSLDKDVMKYVGYVKITTDSSIDGADKGDSGKICSDLLKDTGSGIYAAWAFKVNHGGELNSNYRVLEEIPEGMELAYIRIKWKGANATSVESSAIANLGSEWTEVENDTTNDNQQSQHTIYYVSNDKKQAMIQLGTFRADHIEDKGSVDVQVVCRVTDPKVLLGGEEKIFTNKVVLQSANGEDLATATADAKIKDTNLTKENGYSTTSSNESQKVTYTIVANSRGQKLLTAEGEKLTLVDALGEYLSFDSESLKAKNIKNGKQVEIQSSYNPKDKTIEIVIPDETPVEITYSVTVNIAPNKTVPLQNSVYWKSYSAKGGTTNKIEQFSYQLSAGGSSGTTLHPNLTIKKIDQDNTSNKLNGVEFEVSECELKDNQIQLKSETQKVKATITDGTCEITTKQFTMEFNTIYEVKETKAADGYKLDETPHYIMCVKQEEGRYPDEANAYIAYCEKKKDDTKYKVAYDTKNFFLEIYNEQKGIVVEKAFINDAAGNSRKPVSGTYKFGLYNNAGGSGSPLDTVSITYSPGDTEAKTAKFKNLDLNTTYYVFELDDKNQPIKDSSRVAIVNGMEYFTSYTTTKNGATESNSATNGDTVTVTNQSRVNKLPSTGSCGVLIYRLAGAILILFAVVLMLMKYKETKTRN